MAQMKENLERTQSVERENASFKKENAALKVQLESLTASMATPDNSRRRFQVPIDPMQSLDDTTIGGSSQVTGQPSTTGVTNVTVGQQTNTVNQNMGSAVNSSAIPPAVNSSAIPPSVNLTNLTVPEGSLNQQSLTRANNAIIDLTPSIVNAEVNVAPTQEELIEQIIARKLEGMEAMIQRIPGVPNPIKKSLPSSFADSPFVDAITLVEMLKKFVFPLMKMYDGTNDPNDHIASYKQRMFTVAIPRELRKACMCKGFGSSLVGPALQWYTNLSNNSIASFAQLTDIFVEQFASSRKLEKLSDDLYRVRQRRDESLRDYVARFNAEKVSITACNVDTAVTAL